MKDLRVNKKIKTKVKVLKVAKELFLSKGYNDTTVAQITKDANIGVGTFYNYFRSKSEIFLETFNGHPEKLAQYTKEIVDNPDDNILETIIKLTNIYLESYSKIDRMLWSEVISAFARNVDANKRSMIEFIEVDLQLVDQLKSLFTVYKNKGVLNNTFNEDAGAQTIYSIFALQIILYIFTDNMTFEIMKKNVIEQVMQYLVR